MKLYQPTNHKLKDCEPTIKFIHRINDLIQAMTSRSIQGSLEFGNYKYKILIDFYEYLGQWDSEAYLKDAKFLSNNTYEGLCVTLKTTTDLMDFLTTECDYKFLMTARLNQDVLEVNLMTQLQK